MENSVTYIGEWWRPDKPKERIAGTLTIIENMRFELLLVGDFTSTDWSLEYILGVATKNTENKLNSFILYKLHKIDTANIGFVKSKYSVSRILKSTLKSVENITRFLSCNLKSSNYSKIHNISHQSFTQNQDDSFSIKSKKNEQFEIYKDNHKKYVFQIGLNFKTKKNESQLKNITSINVIYNNPTTLINFEKDRKILDCFFSMICDNVTFSNDVILYSDFLGKKGHKIPFKLYEKNKLLEPYHNNARNYEVLINLNDIYEKQYLSKFSKFYNENLQIFNYFINNKSNENLQPENRFLNMVTALEIYSRTIKPDRKKKASYLDFREKIFDLPPKY